MANLMDKAGQVALSAAMITTAIAERPTGMSTATAVSRKRRASKSTRRSGMSSGLIVSERPRMTAAAIGRSRPMAKKKAAASGTKNPADS